MAAHPCSVSLVTDGSMSLLRVQGHSWQHVPAPCPGVTHGSTSLHPCSVSRVTDGSTSLHPCSMLWVSPTQHSWLAAGTHLSWKKKT